VGVWAEEPGLAALGGSGSPDRLLAGIRVAAEGETAARWTEYRMVCFL
jgi:hypothetical protein